MITLIDTRTEPFVLPLISHTLLAQMTETISESKSVLISYPRRGTGSWICHDCGYRLFCPTCHSPLMIHEHPKEELRCHNCQKSTDLPTGCPNCGSITQKYTLPGLQSIEKSLKKQYPNIPIIRIDNDTYRYKKIPAIQTAPCIVLGNDYGQFVPISSLGITCILAFEYELSATNYTTEEDIYMRIALHKRNRENLIIQSSAPENPLLMLITHGNHLDFIKYGLAERKTYGYPPYVQMASVYIEGKDEKQLLSIETKIRDLFTEKESLSIMSDELHKTRLGKYRKELLFRGTLDTLSSTLYPIVQKHANSVFLEWH